MSLQILKIVLPAATAALLAILPASLSGVSKDPSGTSVTEAAAAIDRLVASDLEQAGLKPNAIANDTTFLRRTYVTLVGRIPTVSEADVFLRDRSRDKRAQLIDRLLASPGHASRMFNWWADLLRVKTRLNRRVSGEPYMHWIRAALTENKPYDVMVAEMLEADGSAHVSDNGATGYYLRDGGMPEDNMANTVRIFLGTRLECAQCHNHPFDKWTQKEFYEMAAFTGGMKFSSGRGRPMERAATPEMRRIQGALREVRSTHGEQAVRSLSRRLIQPLQQGISGSGSGLARLPKEYQYDDAKPLSIVKAQTIFGTSPEVKSQAREPSQRRQPTRGKRRGKARDNFPAVDSRQQYAAWLTSPDNPRFTKVVANRMWKFAMGYGLIEPVDDIREDTKASNPQLLSQLEKLMVDVKYDLHQFLRVLLNTKAWQREAAASEPVAGEVFHFTGPLVRRMSAEQMWDSMLTLVVDDVDGTVGDPDEKAKEVYARQELMTQMTDAELKVYLGREALRYSDPAKYRRTMQQERDRRNEGRKAKTRPLLEALRRAQRRRDVAAVARIKGELKELGVDTDRRRRPGRRRGAAGRVPLRRASALPQPTPDGHFIRQFGQSDREQIQTSHEDPTVPQVLNLMNGFVEDYVLAPASTVMQEIREARGVTAKINAAYLAVLSRESTTAERALWRNDIARDVAQGVDDLVWALVNTHEFRFIQ